VSATRPRVLLTALIAAIPGSVLLSTGCQMGQSAQAKQPRGSSESARPVKVTTVQKRPTERTVRVVGSLAAQDQATLSNKVAGRLQEIPVDLGTAVKQGQLVARIEPLDYQVRLQSAEAAVVQARVRLGLPAEGTDDRVKIEDTGTVRQARAQLDEARTNRQRYAELQAQGIVSRAQYDAMDAAEKVAESRYQLALEEVRDRQAVLAQRRSEAEVARQQLISTAVHAPFDGVVQERRANIGEYLPSGSILLTMVKIDPLRLRAEVPEREARGVKQRQRVRVAVEGDPTPHAGRIVRLSPVIAEQNRMLIVEAEVPNPQGALRPGSFAQVDIVVEENALALAVPKSAVVTFAGIEKVLQVKDGKAKERVITTRRLSEEWTEVLAGLEGGEEVVINPGNLQTGQAVVASR
jgi:RND family efflux transporter MFP subunit